MTTFIDRSPRRIIPSGRPAPASSRDFRATGRPRQTDRAGSIRPVSQAKPGWPSAATAAHEAAHHGDRCQHEPGVRGDQLTRQWRLLQLIDRPEGITVDDASRDLECAVRTIWRDLSVLQDVGFPIFNDRGADGRRAVWRLTEEFRRRLPLDLGLAELAALLMSRELLRPAAVLGPALDGAFGKLEPLLIRAARTYLVQMRDVVGVRALGAKLQAPAAAHLQALQRALLEGRRLRLRYHAMSRDEETDRRVDPYHLTLFQGGFYLVAHCHLRQAVRLFAVERIREVRVLGERFVRPADFDVDRYLARLTVIDARQSYDGDGRLLRLGLQA